jgi:OOP family OmpA-OmpF porin
MRRRFLVMAFLTLSVLTVIGDKVLAQSKVEGVIEGRNGETLIVRTAEQPNLVVVLTDNTDVAQYVGAVKARSKSMSMGVLVPGLPIKAEGTYDTQNRLVADKIRFKGNDLKQAQAIQAGLKETHEQAQQNKAELEKHNAELQAQNAALKEHNAKIAENKAAIEAASARFGQLDDYYILDEVVVFFGSGKTKVAPKYNPQLLALAEKSRGVDGYVIEVTGFASKSGSEELNQRLSDERSRNVTNILLQQGKVPRTRILAPAAMGESTQVAASNGLDPDAANRRVVVRILQNKAIAGR